MEKVVWAYKTRQIQQKDNLNIAFLVVGAIVILLLVDTYRRKRKENEQ